MRTRLVLGMIGATGVVLLLGAPAAAGGGGTCHQPASNGRGTTVEMRKICFAPTVLRVGDGEKVTFVNREPVPHTVTGVGWGTFEEIDEGEAVTVRFSEPGVYAYTCVIHPGMSGAIVAGNARGPGAATGDDVVIEPVSAAELGLEAPVASGPVEAEPASAGDSGDGPRWPAIVTVVGAVAGGAGFGLGRVRRRPEA